MKHVSLVISIMAILSAVTLAPVYAGESLTLSLETPSLESHKESTSQANTPVEEPKQEQTSTKSVSTEKDKKLTIGRVAVVESAKATIYSKRSTKGRVYSVCQKGTPLAIIGEVDGWYGILMIDGSTGWIHKSGVRLLDYQLVTSQPPSTRGEYASRGSVDMSRSTALGNQIVQSAFQYMGVPYVWGGNTTSGLDCSGFLKKVFAENGFNLPRTAREQANVGTPVSFAELQPGDRLYFCYKQSYIDHCGIYIGDGMYIHSSVTNHGVAVDKLAGKNLNALISAMR